MNPYSIGGLISCDISQLTKLPKGSEVYAELQGQSVAQIKFASEMRAKKMAEWQPRLPKPVFLALKSVTDSGFFLANQQAGPLSIKWPRCWTTMAVPEPKPLKGPAPKEEPRPDVNSLDLENFDSFAKIACRSPELSYLVMYAELYRRTKNDEVLAKLNIGLERVETHLAAIRKIAGV